jgi:cobalt/nickel transport system permease protein
LRHAVLEEWSRGNGPLHRRDPRAKTAVLLFFLIAVAMTHRDLWLSATGWMAMLAAVAVWGRLPLAGLLARSAVVLPFSAVFALVSWAGGDTERAISLVVKSYLSGAAVLLVVASTPMPRLLRGLEAVGAPRFLLLVSQFLYRYLFVISEEAQHMRTAAVARGALAGSLIARPQRFRAAAGALAVLFARSYQRAEEIHRAMVARGFEGRFHPLDGLRFGAADALFLAIGAAAPLVVRTGVEWIR